MLTSSPAVLKRLTSRTWFCCCVWVWYLVCHFKGRICIEDVWKQGGPVSQQVIVAWRMCKRNCCMMIVHKNTSLAELHEGKWHLPGGYLPTSHPGGPGLVPGNQYGIYGAQCETWADFSEYLILILSVSFHQCTVFICLSSSDWVVK